MSFLSIIHLMHAHAFSISWFEEVALCFQVCTLLWGGVTWYLRWIRLCISYNPQAQSLSTAHRGPKALDPLRSLYQNTHRCALSCIPYLCPCPSHQPRSTIQNSLFALAWPIWPSESWHQLDFLPPPLQCSPFPNPSGNFVILLHVLKFSQWEKYTDVKSHRLEFFCENSQNEEGWQWAESAVRNTVEILNKPYGAWKGQGIWGAGMGEGWGSTRTKVMGMKLCLLVIPRNGRLKTDRYGGGGGNGNDHWRWLSTSKPRQCSRGFAYIY